LRPISSTGSASGACCCLIVVFRMETCSIDVLLLSLMWLLLACQPGKLAAYLLTRPTLVTD
jgi:hypothetical protein